MSNYKVGDKFEMEIESEFVDEYDNKLYRIKGFKSFVFDDNILNKLKKIEPEIAPIKTVKASELAVDTKVICWNNDCGTKFKRFFAQFEYGIMYAFPNGCTSWSSGYLNCKHWKYMTLEDGTVVLPE